MLNTLQNNWPNLSLILLASISIWKIALPKLFEKELTKYKSELDLHRDKLIGELNIQRDINQHELQKSFLIKEIETKNLHALYPQIYEELQKLFLQMRGFYGELAKDFTQLSDAELLDLLTKTHLFGGAKANELLQSLKIDPNEGNEAIRKLIFDRELLFSLEKIKLKDQYFREKSLFISESAQNQIFLISGKLREMWKALRLAYIPNYVGTTDGFVKAIELEEEINGDFKKLESIMRKELKLS